MQIVIDIDDTAYTRLVNSGYVSFNVINVVRQGTPLPKGHGRISDMDEAIECIKETEGDDAIWAISLIEWACSKRTIIEADKSESEG